MSFCAFVFGIIVARAKSVIVGRSVLWNSGSASVVKHSFTSVVEQMLCTNSHLTVST